MKDIIVSTGDIKQMYKIIGPVYYQISNKGIFSSTFSEKLIQYRTEIAAMKKLGMVSKDRSDWGFLYGEWSVGQNDFDRAFYIAVRELQKRARLMGADAIVWMRQDIDLDTNGFAYFYLQMYGTAVKFTGNDINLSQVSYIINEHYHAKVSVTDPEAAEMLALKMKADLMNPKIDAFVKKNNVSVEQLQEFSASGAGEELYMLYS